MEFSQTVTIPTERVSGLMDRVAESHKRAVKLGVEGMGLVVGQTETRIHIINGIEVPRKYTEVTISGLTPKFEGWHFVASLDISEAGTIVRSLPGVECPLEHRERGNVCDHCNTDRNRTTTYVVVHDDGRSMNVGRTCLKDFMGSDRLNPESIANYFSHVLNFMGSIESEWGDSEGYGGSGSSAAVINLPFLLELTGATVSAFGWVSKSMITSGKSDGPATAELVQIFLSHNRNRASQSEKEMVATVKENWDATLGKREGEARAAIEWVTSPDLAATNDYIHNIKTIGRRGWTTFKDFGFACSILTSWRMAVARDVERREQAEAVDSNHIGEVKVRAEYDLKVTGLREMSSDFGVTILHMMEDRSGNRVKWFSSGARLDPQETGEFIRVKATVKSHGEYRGIKETLMNRIKRV